MSSLRLILLSLVHFWKMNTAVACGVAVGTAVLTGALLVGDSMRGSLRDLVLSGLGDIDEALVADHFFREELARDESNKASELPPAPVILQVGGLEAADRDSPARVDQVNLVGCDRRFWQLFPGSASTPPARDEIVLNEPLARLLAVKKGDAVMLSLAKPGAIPAESAMGRKKVSRDSMRLVVSQVIAANGLGRFDLRPNQRAPLDACVSLAALQDQLNEPDRVNAIFRATPEPPAAWRPQLADYGIHVEKSPLGYIDITTDRLMFSPAMERAIAERWSDPRSGLSRNPLDVQPVLTYLANSIALDGQEVPYSTITAIDFQRAPPLGPFLSTDGKPAAPLEDDQIALNDWTANRLKAKLGDTISVTYYEPESTTGLLQEKTVKLKLAAILKLQGAAADRRLTPTVRGLTDKNTIEDWDLPFPVDLKRIKRDDDQFWRKYGATPKAFVSLAAGQRMWGSNRFGNVTSLRVRPAQGTTAESLAAELDLDPWEQGFIFRPVRKLALDAANGSTPFGEYFVSFSFFVIAAAVMLVLLLFRLGIEQRARHLGLLLALGFRRRQVARLLIIEGLAVAAVGSAVGTLAGAGYAALMLLGLRTWWLPAIGTPFLTLHVYWESPAIGFASGLVLAFIAIGFAVWRIGRASPRRLLAGESARYSALSTRYPVRSAEYAARRKFLAIFHFSFFNSQFAILFLALAVPLSLLFIPMSQDAKVGAFFGAGSWTLVMLLVFVYRQLGRGATGAAVARGRGNILRMAVRNAARNPGRSALAIGLTAAACFLIAAVSVFHVDPAREAGDKTGASGGFALIGQSTVPIYYDLNTSGGRKELGASPADEALLKECRFYAFRVKPGDEASCLNLYQARQPRMLGVGADFIARGGFGWADPPPAMKNPWEVLARGPSPLVAASSTVPTVLDQTTATYGLKPPKARGETYQVADVRNRKLTLEVAGLLADSIFEGDLLVGEANLRRYDPDVAGYRYFLVETPPDKIAAVQQALQRVLGDYGFSTETTVERLSALAAVQNTYLATFQSLGGLGLLLGTIGLAVVEWRNVLERRGELALLRAAGYRARTLGFLVATENVFLLVAGLIVGIVAAFFAVLPSVLARAGSVPWLSLAAIFAAVLVVGLLVSLAAMRGAVRTPILAALREER